MTKQELATDLYSNGFATRETLKQAFDDLTYTIHRVASKQDIAPLHIAVQVMLNSLAKQIESLN